MTKKGIKARAGLSFWSDSEGMESQAMRDKHSRGVKSTEEFKSKTLKEEVKLLI